MSTVRYWRRSSVGAGSGSTAADGRHGIASRPHAGASTGVARLRAISSTAVMNCNAPRAEGRCAGGDATDGCRRAVRERRQRKERSRMTAPFRRAWRSSRAFSTSVDCIYLPPLMPSSSSSGAAAVNLAQGHSVTEKLGKAIMHCGKRKLALQLALTNTKKGTMKVAEYVAKMRALGDEMAAAGRPLDEEDMVQYIISGLDEDFSPIVSALCTKSDPITVGELYSQLLNFETLLDLYRNTGQGGAAFVANRGGGRGNKNGAHNNFNGGSGRGALRGRGGGQARGGQGRGTGPWIFHILGQDRCPTCQVCFKRGHTAADCWYRFDEDYVADEKLAAAATNSYGATDHITGELEKLTTKEKYNGGEQIHTASGAAKKNLISASQLAADNSAFLELHSKFFSIKDLVTKDILLEGKCRHGLYLIPNSFG
uniref:OSJNBb0016D16.15 protein n=1 Tax=Oryza sativa subsp. japonica TaxID=39947 RepID=Q7XN18_ORYSJ|nr:OSJNBb0016D16.15 [Oryza sativa Japonica Group]